MYIELFHLNSYSNAYLDPSDCQVLFRDHELYFVIILYFL
jgi:hypothetical protein